jgi:hypothetical protein
LVLFETHITGPYNFTKAQEANNAENLFVIEYADMAAKYAQICSSSASASMWFPSSSQPCAAKRWRLSGD